MSGPTKTHLIAGLLLAAGCALPAFADDRPDHSDRHGDRRRGPEILIDPSDFIDRRPRPDVDDPAFVMGEIRQCATAGTLLFVDCLRANHGAIMIRRLEACLGSEVIPPDVAEVEPCLPVPGRP